LDIVHPDFLRHHEYLKRRPRLQRIHQPHESGPVRKFGPADSIVDVDVLVGYGPALSSRVRFRVLDLARDGLLLIRDASLVGSLP
jgi:hypothetical protein